MATHTSDHSEDFAFVRRIVDGDESAADELNNRFSQRFQHIAFQRGVSANDCQDVVQETLMSAVDQMRRDKYRGEASLGTWLQQILYGKIIDHLRKRYGMAIDHVDKNGIPIEVENLKFVRDATVVTQLEVRQAVRKLPRKSRLILLMKQTEGFTIEEISRWMGLSVGQVSHELYKAQRLFKKEILNEAPPDKKRR